MNTEFCDYCGMDLPNGFLLRAVGFDTNLGFRAPLVRTWCGNCKTDDEIDPEADAETKRVFQRQAADARKRRTKKADPIV